MRVAVAQIKLYAGQRSRNLGSVTRAVVRAAEHDPAPDLIVLPGACDLGPAIFDPGFLTPAMCQGFAETLGALAREWGVWIAAGYAVMTGGQVGASATLLDPDGDVYIRSVGGNPARNGRGQTPRGATRLVVRSTALGAVALQPGTAVDIAAAGGHVDLIIIPVAAGGPGECPGTGDGGADLARATQAYVCVARGVGQPRRGANGQKPGSAVFDRTGQKLAETPCGRPDIVFAELDIDRCHGQLVCPC